MLSRYGLPTLDNVVERAKAQKVKDETCSTCRLEYYGKTIKIDIDLKKLGTAFELPEGTAWILEVEPETAKGLQFYFDDFYIPEEGTLHIYSEDGETIQGAFTNMNVHETGRFATAIFPSKKAILEYYQSTPYFMHSGITPGLIQMT